jgi:hypothetical protein
MPKTCSQCQTENADEANNCSNCGAALVGATTATTAAPAVGQPAAAASAPATGGSSLPAFKFDAARWTLADRISGVATLVLFICLFLPWFTVSGVTVGSISVGGGSVNGLWHGWMYLTLIICIAIIAYLVLRAGWERLPISQDVPHLTVMLVATIVNVVLTVIAFIDKPGGSATGWGFGAIVGLIASLAAAAPYAIPPLRAKTM